MNTTNNTDKEVKELLKTLALIMGEALATATAVRRAVEERDPSLVPMIDKHYANLQSTALMSLKELFSPTQNEKLEEILRSFSSGLIH